MKKLLLFLMIMLTAGIAVNAQDSKDKVKKTSSIPQKVHNTFSKHKHHNGYKTKHEHGGKMHKHKVNYKKGEISNKTKTD
ncbi:MAG: hypothetical protein H0W12_01245 [Chitinophagaceae bacterium]|nr:hypothetical protein [Chitinophagaceae bacterium]